MSTIKLYNTLGRKKQTFKPISEGKVGLYTCGPTVYWYQHIGNLRSYIFADVLRRVLEYNKYSVNQVINVTDVGHLTSDADEGEDKMEKAAIKEGKTASEIANFYLSQFKDDFNKLNIQEPSIWAKATNHIQEQIDLIKILEEKGYTYKTSDGIYFTTKKFKKYGALSKLNIKGIEAGKRIEMGEKINPTDFALWKFSAEAGKRQQEWQSPWGLGFPGWHIECSAMSMKYLGNHFDIHTGGEDHISVHHSNEIAQSEAASGKKFVNYWLHGAFLTFKGEKVSKSKGGLFTVSELQEKGFLPLAYRYLCLTASYRSPLDFSLESLTNAQNSYLRLKNIVAELTDDGKINKKYLKSFEKNINNDLDSTKALAVLWDLLRDKKADGKFKTVIEMDKVLGLDLFKVEKFEVSSDVNDLVKAREEARKNKEYQKADEIRKKIEDKGYRLEDLPIGTKISKV